MAVGRLLRWFAMMRRVCVKNIYIYIYKLLMSWEGDNGGLRMTRLDTGMDLEVQRWMYSWRVVAEVEELVQRSIFILVQTKTDENSVT